MTITGMTRLIGVVGDPIDRARSPEALNELCGNLGIDVTTIPVGMAPEGLASLVKAAASWRNLAGFLITMPYKLEISWLVDELTPSARATGAVNVVKRESDGKLIGDQMDGAGFVSGLQSHQVQIAHREVCMIGAGGVGRAIAFAMLEAGAASVTILNRSKDRAAALRNDLAEKYGLERALLGDPSSITTADIVINATSMGSDLNPGIPLDIELLRPDAVVADVVAKPEYTPLLVAARERGCLVVPGRAMQVAQFKSILEFLVPESLDAGR